jgi:hypothetical protein
MGRREDVLRAEDEAWRRVEHAVDGLGPEELERPGLGADAWSIKDLLWHLARWQEEAARVLSQAAWDVDRGSTEPGWVDRLNAEALAAGRRMDLEGVRAGGRERRARMRSAFEALAELPPAAVEWFEESGPLHYAEHGDDLARWTERLRPQG